MDDDLTIEELARDGQWREIEVRLSGVVGTEVLCRPKARLARVSDISKMTGQPATSLDRRMKYDGAPAPVLAMTGPGSLYDVTEVVAFTPAGRWGTKPDVAERKKDITPRRPPVIAAPTQRVHVP